MLVQLGSVWPIVIPVCIGFLDGGTNLEFAFSAVKHIPLIGKVLHMVSHHSLLSMEEVSVGDLSCNSKVSTTIMDFPQYMECSLESDVAGGSVSYLIHFPVHSLAGSIYFLIRVPCCCLTVHLHNDGRGLQVYS